MEGRGAKEQQGARTGTGWEGGGPAGPGWRMQGCCAEDWAANEFINSVSTREWPCAAPAGAPGPRKAKTRPPSHLKSSQSHWGTKPATGNKERAQAQARGNAEGLGKDRAIDGK